MNDQQPRPFPDVQGRCPACGWTSLFLADGGYITCSRLECPQPDAASTLLERDVRNDPVTCDATEVINGFFGRPVALGPCVLRHGHDGPGHKAANGAQWWPTAAADTANPAQTEPEVAALHLTYRLPRGI